MLISLLVTVIVVGLLVGLALYGIEFLSPRNGNPGILPGLFGNIARFLVVAIAVIYIADKFLL